MLNYTTVYAEYANTVLDWLGMDNELLYNAHLKTKYDLLKKNNWIDTRITYEFNEHGFRCDPFTNDPTIIFLGGSDVCGVGLLKHTLWPELVASKLNMKCANLGIGAGSNDTAFRLAHGWINKLNTKLVIMLPPPPVRLELILDSSIENILPLDKPNDYTLPWMAVSDNSEFNTLKNHLAIEHICNLKNIKFLKLSGKIGKFGATGDYARDLAHAGVLAHRNFSDYVLSLV